MNPASTTAEATANPAMVPGRSDSSLRTGPGGEGGTMLLSDLLVYLGVVKVTH